MVRGEEGEKRGKRSEGVGKGRAKKGKKEKAKKLKKERGKRGSSNDKDSVGKGFTRNRVNNIIYNISSFVILTYLFSELSAKMPCTDGSEKTLHLYLYIFLHALGYTVPLVECPGVILQNS